ncbi:DNA helicase IV [Nakamurella flavida]|uniref:ATP-binding domain-containing protein n=1 Tax=Nakamurella flavida TaxID=363630 RepID=UPI00277F3472|nr:ATP-binding domain-containing protein [Nakamurella flavida]MDP9778384.1 DNA helicase IV [Nakamurella flavida]
MTDSVQATGSSRPGPGQDDAATGPEAELKAEQAYVLRLYERLDDIRRQTIQLRDRYLRDSDGTPGGRVERDIAYARHASSLVALNAAEDKLCFGRLDFEDGEDAHIGRMGIFDDRGDQKQLLMDWRAPSARPFYVATAIAPLGVHRRRHLRTRRRVVESLSDEYLQIRTDGEAGTGLEGGGAPLIGEAALLAALEAPRTGRMGDIVETIQAEQDRIIRADQRGVMVVQGGPGTGKTAVALHRAAYLLYTHREQLTHRGVLVVGPNATFLRYISQVLPSLGENAVVLSTPADLFPGLRATVVDEPAVAALKGQTRMAGVLANALLDRQRMPAVARKIDFEAVPGRVLTIDKALMKRAQARAWGTRAPHNQARRVFVRTILDGLLKQTVEKIDSRGVRAGGEAGDRIVTPEDRDALRRELMTDENVRDALAELWPRLTPQTLLADLLGSERRLAFAAPDHSPADRELLSRPAPGATPARGVRRVWTTSDVALLDEAAELIGPDDQAERDRLARERTENTDYAQEVMELLDTSPDGEGEGLAGMVGMVSAEDLADLQEERVTLTSTAERALSDREWTYGHIIVDEAQELSPMIWRLLMRRNPLRSMTLVGDLAQTSDPAGATSWGRVLRPYVRDAWRLEPLTVNYRTPAEIMAVADRVLHRIDPGLAGPTSVREAGVLPWRVRAADGELAATAARVVAQEAASLDGRQLAVLVAPDDVPAVDAAVRAALPDLTQPRGDDLPPVVQVMTVRDAKGLEFDVVVVVEPAAVVASSRRGWNDLYVALTRSTQRLGVVHTGDVPAELTDLQDVPAPS